MHTKLLFASLLLMFTFTAQGAVTLYTSTLFFDQDAGGGLECRVVNVSNKSLKITIELYGTNGSSLKHSSSTVKPLNQYSINSPSYGVQYCKFTVKNGEAGDVRASINAYKNDGSTNDGDIVALPAQ